MMDEALNKARRLCEEFLANKFSSSAEQTTAFEELLKATNAAVLVTTMSANMLEKSGQVLEIFNGHKVQGPFKQVLRISMNRSGRLMREDLLTCVDGCHTYAAKQSAITLEQLNKSGVSLIDVAKNIKNFLDDPNASLPELVAGMKN